MITKHCALTANDVPVRNRRFMELYVAPAGAGLGGYWRGRFWPQQQARNCASENIGKTGYPNFDIALGTMLREVASCVRTVPLAALNSIAALGVENSSRRKAPWAGDKEDDGGKTSWFTGAADTYRQ